MWPAVQLWCEKKVIPLAKANVAEVPEEFGSSPSQGGTRGFPPAKAITSGGKKRLESKPSHGVGLPTREVT